jgi:hypothetical protein
MVFNNKSKIAFLLLLILACLIVNFIFYRGISRKVEGMGNEEQVIKYDKVNGFDKIYNEYGSLVTDGYYLTPFGTEMVDEKYFKQYTVKKVPAGFVAGGEKIGIIPVTASASSSMTEAILPEYRELFFSEYATLPPKPIPGHIYDAARLTQDDGKTAPIPSGFFRVKLHNNPTDKDYFMMVKIPINHALLGDTDSMYLKYVGPNEPIKYQGNAYVYSDTDTGEKLAGSSNKIQPVDAGYYKIKMMKQSSPNDSPPSKVKYHMAKIPDGYVLDSKDPTFVILNRTNMVDGDNTQYDQNVDYNKVDKNSQDQSNQKDANKGVYYQFDSTGKLVEVNYKESNFAPVLYYIPGAYKFGSSNFVPNYEDSVYLSRVTRQSQTMTGTGTNSDNRAEIVNTRSTLGGFCNSTKNNKMDMEQKCNKLSLDACASTSCCVLLGGQKCVAGNENGAYMTANYTDYTLRNKDFYYYQGKCYGNCNV